MSGGGHLIVGDPWQQLRTLTPARIALGRAGDSLPTAAVLDFALAHAQARDAVHAAFDRGGLEAALRPAGFASIGVHSAAADRTVFLRRPDLGRRLAADSRDRLQSIVGGGAGPDLVVVFADGLSASAVAAHARPLLLALRERLGGWRLAPVVVAEQARVALGDEIGAILGGEQVLMLIGERPGLSSPDSLGAYLTFAPRPGRVDAERNCVSNIRTAGLSYDLAADKLAWLLAAARRLRLSGVGLKDDSGDRVDGLPNPDSAG